MGKEKVELTGRDVHVKGTSRHTGAGQAQIRQKRETGETLTASPARRMSLPAAIFRSPFGLCEPF